MRERGRTAAEKEWDEQINAEGNLIMPGFKNAHTHSADDFPALPMQMT